jgi:hypothetical protein
MPKRSGRLLVGLSAALEIAGVLLLLSGSAGPRLTLENASLVIRYGASAGAGLLCLGLGLILLARAVSEPWLGVAVTLLALVVFLLGVDWWVFRFEASPWELKTVGLWGRTRLPWVEVSRVEAGPSVVVVWGRGDAQVRISTRSFTPEQRATLDRTIARHVRESGSAVGTLK